MAKISELTVRTMSTLNYSVFDALYSMERKDWGGNSGPGSDALSAQPYRQFLEFFIASNKIKTIVDFGCGDWQFSRFINFGAADYFGVDVARDVIEKNKNRYSSETVKFSHFDGTDFEALPTADLLIIKDVLQHLPDAAIKDIHDNLILRYPFVLITNSFSKIDTPRNIDICVGEFRCLDLTLNPYFFKGAYVAQYYSPAYELIRTLLVANT